MERMMTLLGERRLARKRTVDAVALAGWVRDDGVIGEWHQPVGGPVNVL